MGFPLRCCRSGKWIQNPSVQLPSCVRMDSTNSSHSSAERTSSNSSTGGSCGAPPLEGLSQLACLDCHTCSLLKWHRGMAWDLNLSPVFTSFFVDGIWLWQYLLRTEGNRTHHAWWKWDDGSCCMGSVSCMCCMGCHDCNNHQSNSGHGKLSTSLSVLWQGDNGCHMMSITKYHELVNHPASSLEKGRNQSSKIVILDIKNTSTCSPTPFSVLMN